MRLLNWPRETANRARTSELKLVFFVLYVALLLYVLISTRSWLDALYVHIVAVFVFSIFYFGLQFLFISIAPLVAIYAPINEYEVRRYLRSFKKNIPAEAVVILAHSNWFKLEAWIKPNYVVSEIKSIVGHLQKKQQDFSFYTKASLNDVERVMADPTIKEIYFVGHGNSHVFQLHTDDILYYCEFSGGKYQKEFVHQVHCGTQDGKSLADYVVPEENKKGCFLIRKSINSIQIEREFKRRTENIV